MKIADFPTVTYADIEHHDVGSLVTKPQLHEWAAGLPEGFVFRGRDDRNIKRGCLMEEYLRDVLDDPSIMSGFDAGWANLSSTPISWRSSPLGISPVRAFDTLCSEVGFRAIRKDEVVALIEGLPDE